MRSNTPRQVGRMSESSIPRHTFVTTRFARPSAMTWSCTLIVATYRQPPLGILRTMPVQTSVGFANEGCERQPLSADPTSTVNAWLRRRALRSRRPRVTCSYPNPKRLPTQSTDWPAERTTTPGGTRGVLVPGTERICLPARARKLLALVRAGARSVLPDQSIVNIGVK